MTINVKPTDAATIDWTARAAARAPAFAAAAARHDAEDEFVAANLQALKAEGFYKALVPVELGGYGASQAEIAHAVRVLGAACGSTALAFAMHSHVVAVAAWRWRHQNAPTDGLLKRVAAENLVLVSSGGSDWLPGGGVAVKVDGGFRVTARKAFASGAPIGDILNTSAIHDDPEAGPTVLHFGVPLTAEGVSMVETWKVMGMRGTGSQDVALDNVFVADAAVAGRRPAGKWHPLFHIISLMAFPIIYAAYAGVADGARALAIAAAKKKAADAHVASIVGAMENAHMAMDLALADMILRAATVAPGPDATSRAMQGRTLVGQGAIRTVELALEAMGGAGFYREKGLERAFRDVQGARFHPLQEGPQLALAGRVALGWDIDG
ncbi:MAG: acyl-CoA dehydrogenase family protein [Hyphomonadaceae bacterium]|nr:acyl-CoA dehydrogenase family protein [Hyphomonadaceae bacterium]